MKKLMPGDFVDGDIPYGIEPAQTIRKKLGPNVKIEHIFTPEKIAECQGIINKAYQDFFGDALNNLKAIEDEYKLAKADMLQAKKHIDKIAELALKLKEQAGNLGLILGFDVAKSLHDYVLNSFQAKEGSFLVVEKHIDVLNIVLKEKMLGGGGQTGQELVASLAKLIKKMG